ADQGAAGRFPGGLSPFWDFPWRRGARKEQPWGPGALRETPAPPHDYAGDTRRGRARWECDAPRPRQTMATFWLRPRSNATEQRPSIATCDRDSASGAKGTRWYPAQSADRY